jgi:hypothetical protein
MRVIMLKGKFRGVERNAPPKRFIYYGKDFDYIILKLWYG